MSLVINIGYKTPIMRDLTLLKLLQDSRASEATDPKDKVYGILALSSDFRSGSVLVPDYNLTVEEVYTSVVKAHIEKYGNLDILGYCGYTAGGLNLPSWVPDWRSAPETITGRAFEKTLQTADGKRETLYHASGKSISFGNYPAMITGPYLHLRGFHVDVVENLYLASDYTDPSLKDVERSWAPENKNDLYTLTGETMEEAYLHTIVSDSCMLSEQASAVKSRGFAMVWPKADGSGDEEQSRIERYAQYELMRSCHKRRFAYSRRGWMGLVPEATQIGDSVAILLGGQMLYVLRSCGEESHFRLVGEAYFHGMMDGEAMEMLDRGEFAMGNIILE